MSSVEVPVHSQLEGATRRRHQSIASMASSKLSMGSLQSGRDSPDSEYDLDSSLDFFMEDDSTSCSSLLHVDVTGHGDALTQVK